MTVRRCPTIAFVTFQWSNVDSNIRQGEAPGGVPSISGIWTHCAARGFDVHVFVLTDLEPDWPRKTVELNAVTFHWIRDPLSKFTSWLHQKHLLGYFKFIWLFRQLQISWRIARSGVRPDIVYCMRSTFLVTGRIWASLVGAKLVLRQYGTWLYHMWFEEKRWLPRIRSLGVLLAHYIPTDLFIMTNDGTRGGRVARWLRYPMERFRFWINGVRTDLQIEDFDAGAFKESIRVPAEAPMLMTLGRLSYWKRLDRAIDAVPNILHHVPEAKLVIVGGGPLEEKLRQRASDRGVSDAVRFVGAVSHDQIRFYLNACDIFIMPNDLTNMCSTLIEGLMAGCCVVTRDVGSTTEIVTDDENSVVLSPGEADDIAEACVRLLENPEERKRLSQAALRGATERFQSWEHRMEMEVDEMERLIGLEGKVRPTSVPKS